MTFQVITSMCLALLLSHSHKEKISWSKNCTEQSCFFWVTYVRMTVPPTNVRVTSYQIATDEDSGILLYKGDKDHIAVELYRGRVRASYDTGSHPASAIYR